MVEAIHEPAEDNRLIDEACPRGCPPNYALGRTGWEGVVARFHG